MAQSATKITNLKSNIQSKAQESVIANRQKVASSTEATQSGATTTPVVIETPKVASTAKGMPSIQRPDITNIIQSTPQTSQTDYKWEINIRDLLWSKTQVTLKKAETPDLLSKTAEESGIIPWNIIAAANATWWKAQEDINKTILNQFTDWFNNITNKSEQDSQYYANKLAQSWVGGLWAATVDLAGDVIDWGTSALWYYSNKALDTIAKWLWAQDTDVTRQRTQYWEERFSPEERKATEEAAKKFWVWAMNIITDTEYFVAKVADVIETSLWGKWWFAQAFQEQQWDFWDIYKEEFETESSKLYDEDLKAQKLSEDVSKWLYDVIWNEEVSNMLWSAVWHIYSNVKDPSLVAYTFWYMAPALILQSAMWWGFRAWTALWTPSQATNVYKDFSQDPELSELYTDNQLFWISTALWGILSMIEQFWDAMWDMPWAKAMSRDIRKLFTTWLKKEVSKTLSKEITDKVENSLIKEVRRPVLNALRKWSRWWIWEWVEELAQETIQTEGAIALGSKREHLTPEQLVTIWWTAIWLWWGMQLPWAAINIKQNQDLKKEYEEFSNALDKLAPWINEETKQAFFSAMITSQQNDANLSEKKVEKYESQVTQLYNQISQLEQQLETTTDEDTKAQVNNQIDWLNNQIKEIDEKINQWRNTRDEINKYLEEYNQQRELEKEILPQEEQQLPKEISWENLSKQTMRIVPDSEVKIEWLEKQITSEQQYKEATGEETPTQRYLNIIKTLNSKTTKYTNSFDWKEFKLKEDLIKELKNMSVEAWARLLSQYDSYSLKEVLGVADRTLKSMKQWRNTRIKQDQLAKLYEQLKMGVDLKNQMIDELKSLKDKASKEEVEWISDYRLITWIWDFDSARSAFSREKTIYWKHLVWLKNVSIKQLEWKITDKVANKFSLMLAKASQILWIDFNKVVWENDLTLTVWKKDNVAWFFNRDWTKESLTDILEELKNKWEDTSQYDNLAERTFKAWIYLATLDNVSVSEATATLVHEFVHMLDYRRVIDLWLKAYINKRSKISRKGTWVSSKEADYILKWDKKWETFNNPEDVDPEWKNNRDKYDELMAWNIDLPQMTYDDVTYANEMLYIYDPTEIFARYAEQYYLWETDKEMFDEYSKMSWYWTEEKFKELIDDFKDLLQNEFVDYQIEEWNRNYVDVMQKLMDFKYNQVLASDKKWLEDIKNSNPDMQQDARVKMLAMQKDYVELSAELDKLEWTISEEIKAEYATELDNLATNMWILEETLENYTRFVDKKVPIENFEAADSALESENLEEDQQQIEDENASFEEQEQMQDEMDEQIEEAWWIQNIDEWKDREKEFTEEERTQKKWERKRNLVESRDSIWDVAKDILTPTMSRIYNINRRVAGRLTQMETQSWINIYRYTQRCQWFVDHMNTLKWTAKLEVTEALLNYWALASEQTEDTIEDYKREEANKLREVLLRNWFKEKDINDMFSVLNDLWNRYKDAWLSISISDMYFPRVVKDYKWLIEYMSRVSWTKIEDKTKDRLMKGIQDIIDNDTYSDAEKERLIRNKLTTQFPSKIKINSKHSEERKLWLLSEWWAGIYAYYEDPTVSLAHYITTMEYAIQRQLFLWWQAKDLWLDIDTINSSNEDSVSSIVEWLVERWEISSNEVNELQKCIIAVMDKKNTPRWIQRIKDLTYTMALTNYISAINQLEDIWVAIIENKWWLISSVKAIFSKAWIKYTDSWLESAYEMFRTNLWISNKLFAASGFNFTDRLGKKCFLNAAWTSMVKRAKNEKSRKYLVERLTAMYWEKTANHIMENVDAWDYMTNWQIDIDVLTDLLYQLWTTQPIYASAMPVSYLRSPHARWFYALSMFSIRQADHIIQSTKQTYKERWVFAASIQAFWFIAMRMFFGTLVWDIWDWLMWKWKDETWLWLILSERWDLALDKFKEDYLKSFSKLWMLSDYDKETFKKDWIWWVIANKMYPYVIQEAHKLRKSTERAFKNEDATELIPMLRDVPIVWKQVASWWNYYLEKATKNWLEWWETSWEKEDWETSSEKEDWETSTEKEDWE